MGIFSSSLSLTRYKVDGQIQPPLMETVLNGLTKNTIQEIDRDPAELAVGWTSLQTPFQPNFNGDSFVVGSAFAFALRIDQKRIPSKLLQKQIALDQARQLKETNRQFLSASEKKMLREQVIHQLYMRLPPLPNIYDLIWHPEEGWLWFFSTLKSANEHLETLFTRSFGLTLIRMFAYSLADTAMGLKSEEKDALSKLSPVTFVG